MSDAKIPKFERIPRHVAIVMDGNNRWAKRRHLPGVAGHKAGVKAVKIVIEQAARLEVDVLTLFAFSSENWQRPEKEVNALMQLFLNALQKEVKKLHEHNIRLIIMGDISGFSSVLQEHIEIAQNLTKDNTGLTLVVAANYGGRWDISHAAQNIAKDVLSGKISPENITPELFSGYTCLNDFPEPDLCIRTGGELRISNFMLWQFAYTELVFSDALWPDFDETNFWSAIEEYNSRTRRFGRTDEQLKEDQTC
ncbi:isoprenyl transferase [Bermanella sp. WJH001]|uniref:isoprenyl transferase n=1 Tax=Bermanella sp. WJH001 TaxID=3048005 RepID=UPI0024BDB62F|nr:isoprenyl transferase [Bermanella sp. WJH001]MDJ1537588.1 isoprenyl transferase [Bermanella sp. WJH001]